MTGAQFEIRIDGTPRSYRDRRDFAVEAATFLKRQTPHSTVEVKDLKSSGVTRRRLQARLMPLKLRPTSLALGSTRPPGLHRLQQRLGSLEGVGEDEMGGLI
jgi:hypothetical protein